MSALIEALKDAGQDFEWYPTTRRMVAVVARHLDERCESIMDIGAGDGRVLQWLSEKCTGATLFGIEKSDVLRQRQPDAVVPVGTEFYEQDLMSLPVDVIFCNPPYREFEAWAAQIIATAYAKDVFLVLPQRWEDSHAIKAALERRGAKAEILHHDDFQDAERRARAVVHVIRVRLADSGYYRWDRKPKDPFEAWFDAHIDTFDREAPIADTESEERALARIRSLDGVVEMVEAFQEDFARMERNYRAIFALDAALLKELGVNKESVREGLKKRMQGLKSLYWQQLFERLDVLTARLTTKTKALFLKRLTGQQGVAFTVSNAYAVALWAIKAANVYFDSQLVDVYRDISTREGAERYASNQRTWVKDNWRYIREDEQRPTHYKLDYRIVLHHWRAIKNEAFSSWEYPGDLHKSCHELIADLVAVFGNLGFRTWGLSSYQREWRSNQWQDFRSEGGETVFQVKAFMNGNLHIRVKPEAMKALNIEAARLLGWLRTPADAVAEAGYTPEDAALFFGTNLRIGSAAVGLLPPAVAGERRLA